MTTTVIQNLEPSKPSQRSGLFQSCGLHESAENKNAVKMKEISDSWDVPEDGNISTSNCTLDSSVHRCEWNVKPCSFSKDDDMMVEPSGCEENNTINNDEGSKMIPHASHHDSMDLNISVDNLPSNQEEEPVCSETTDVSDISFKGEIEEKSSSAPENVDALSVKAEMETADVEQQNDGAFTVKAEVETNDVALENESILSEKAKVNSAEFVAENVRAFSVKAEIDTNEKNTSRNDEAAAANINVSNVGAILVKSEMETDNEYDNSNDTEAVVDTIGGGDLNITSPKSSLSNSLEDSNITVDVSINNVIVSPVNSDNILEMNDTAYSVSDIELRAEESTDVINVTETDNEEVINVTATTDNSMTGNSPEQEVVDVESYQPCVVDLTCEEEDDVDVVAVVEPVIFIGTEQRRRSRRLAAAPREDNTDDLGVLNVDNGDIIDDDTNNNAVNERNDDFWQVLNHPEIDLRNPNLTFGSLLEQAHVETVDDTQVQPPRSPVRRPQRELRRSRRQRHSRSRSPVLFPMDLEDNQPPIANIVHAVNHMMPEEEWIVEPPNQLPLDGNPLVDPENPHRIVQIPPPRPPTSPPHLEQPTITCLVCLDSVATINSSSRTLCSTVCGHVFCSACIKEVVKQRKQCPVCRKRLTKKQYHPLFI